ncbi:glycosyltransferase [bacterium]|nr:glycosyltransferase [bacterium]
MNFGKKNKAEVTISILCFNRLNATKDCVNSILQSKTKYDYNIILTDNGSYDKANKDFLIETYKNNENIALLLHNGNMGFIDGHRKALEIATGKYFLLLNNDIIVYDGWLDDLVDKIKKDKNAKAVGVHPCKLDNNGVGGIVSKTDFDYVEGDCLMVETEFIKEFGLFSPKLYFIYYEDSDLCLRLKEHNYGVAYCDTNKIVHIPMVKAINTSKDKTRHVHDNQEYFKKRWGYYLKHKTFKNAKYIIKRKHAIGDTLYTLPIAKTLKELNPSCNILLETDCPQIAKIIPYIDSTIDTGSISYDGYNVLDCDFAHENNPMTPIYEAFWKSIGIKVNSITPDIPINNDVNAKLKDKYNFPYIIAHWGPSFGWDGRNVDKETIDCISKLIKNEGLKIIEVGTSKNSKYSDYVLLNQEWDVDIELVRNSAGFIGIDSSIMHIAQALGTKGSAIFGCVDPKTRLTENSSIIEYTADAVCKFCWNKSEPPKTFIQCRRGDNICIKNINPIQFAGIAVKHITGKKMSKLFINKNNIKLENLKVDWGCGFRKEKGYVGIDIQDYDNVDIVCDVMDVDKQKLPKGSCIEIRSLHFIEHHTYKNVIKILKEWKELLANEGVVRIFFPDMSMLSRKTNDARMLDFSLGQWQNQYDVHKSWWTQDLMVKFLEEVGFKNVKAIPYTGPLHTVTNMVNRKEICCTSGVEGEK